MYETLLKAIKEADHICIIQAENPDGDSLGSALALEELLGNLNRRISMYCPVDMPKYLRYITGWDRVSDTLDYDADMYIIVDTASMTLLNKALTTENIAQFNKKPTFVIDHHTTESDLTFDHVLLTQNAVATSELIYDLAKNAKWDITPLAAEQMLVAILSDSLGLTSEAVSVRTLEIVTELLRTGSKISDIETRRREFMKKSAVILTYKGQLLQRVKYELDGQLAIVHVPWEEIEQYSDAYNPGALVIDEMRLVEGVKLAGVIKTYPDGKLTGKLRANPEAKIAETVASYFGGGGHPYAAGFRVYDTYEKIYHELIDATQKALETYEVI
jgi:phosphoesterase RecJ-like protein